MSKLLGAIEQNRWRTGMAFFVAGWGLMLSPYVGAPNWVVVIGVCLFMVHLGIITKVVP